MNEKTYLTHEDKMKLLAAFTMLTDWLQVVGHDWTDAERATYEQALNVIGPID